ncbi:MAG: dihydroneopterin aldolase [Candidatus Symbiodolus clandestinus]
MDKLLIKRLQVLTTIGVYPWEQAILQPLLLDLQLELDLQPAAQQEKLQQSIDYEQVATLITEHLRTQRFLLIERVAEVVAERLLTEFPLTRITLTVTKPRALAHAKSAGITITRNRTVVN